jgi:hypothetical protein
MRDPHRQAHSEDAELGARGTAFLPNPGRIKALGKVAGIEDHRYI